MDSPQSSSSAGRNRSRSAATTAPQRLKTPPIKTTAKRTTEFWTGNWLMLTPPVAAASSAPDTPAMNDARPNAHSRYSVVLTPAATAVAWLWRSAAHARPVFALRCHSARRNMTTATTTTYR